jgi:metal transporter CNNM
MEALPIFLHKIVGAVGAIVISTIFVVIFGEVLPQAFCTGPSQMKIAEGMAPIVRVNYLFHDPFLKKYKN